MLVLALCLVDTCIGNIDSKLDLDLKSMDLGLIWEDSSTLLVHRDHFCEEFLN